MKTGERVLSRIEGYNQYRRQYYWNDNKESKSKTKFIQNKGKWKYYNTRQNLRKFVKICTLSKEQKY